MAVKPRHWYEFGPYRFDAVERVVLRGEDVVALPPKACDLLLVLLENRGHVIGKDELMKQVWQDTYVEEANLSHNIYKLREALEEAGGPRFIQTVPRRGYRFVGTVTERHGDAASGSGATAPTAGSAPTLYWGEREVVLAQGRNLLGRTPECVIRIDAISVSREHAAVVIKRQEAVVEDLGSKNGTFVNGTRITGSVSLSDGDEIRLGSVPLKFHSSAGLPSTRTVDRSS